MSMISTSPIRSSQLVTMLIDGGATNGRESPNCQILPVDIFAYSCIIRQTLHLPSVNDTGSEDVEWRTGWGSKKALITQVLHILKTKCTYFDHNNHSSSRVAGSPTTVFFVGTSLLYLCICFAFGIPHFLTTISSKSLVFCRPTVPGDDFIILEAGITNSRFVGESGTRPSDHSSDHGKKVYDWNEISVIRVGRIYV